MLGQIFFSLRYWSTCKQRWVVIVVADMVADMVADIEEDKVADIKVDMVADMEVDTVADINIDIDMEIQIGERVGQTFSTRCLPGLRIF